METRIGDLTINYELEGPAEAPCITLSHSLATRLDLWDMQLPILRGKYRILRFDTRGHGRSSAPQGPFSMETLARDVIDLLDSLNIERTGFIGISMGGMIGQVLACEYPERIEKLVLCDTTSRVPPETGPIWEDRIKTAETKGMKALAGETLERWLSGEFRGKEPKIADWLRSMIVETPAAGYAGCCRAIAGFDVSNRLSKVVAPTLIVTGEKDESAPVSAAESIQKQIAGSRLVIVPGALHLSIIEAAGFFNRTLRDFLSSR